MIHIGTTSYLNKDLNVNKRQEDNILQLLSHTLRLKGTFIICLAILSMVLISCNDIHDITGTSDIDVSIFPDYKEITIPVNLAPLNFKLNTSGKAFVRFESENFSFDVTSKKGAVKIPRRKWQRLLESSVGMPIVVTVAEKTMGKYQSYNPFNIYIAQEKIDPFIAYRLIAPVYELWGDMGIYEYDLESNKEKAIFENKQTDMNCVNCHSFKNNSPEYMSLHLRATHPGTYIFKDGEIEKLNINSEIGISSLVYPAWHPSGKYVAYSNNITQQGFHVSDPNRIEVFDNSSNISVYDIDNNTVLACHLLFSKESFETFPTFSPDGKTLYFCSSKAVEMPANYRDVHYSLCKISFNPENGTFGTTIDTVYKCDRNRTFTFPRISPDGNYLLFTEAEYGNFTIWHEEADLKMMDLRTGELVNIGAWNSDHTESYHSWSSNGRWVVFSSRRDDGLYTRPYIGYFDDSGNAHKAFILPQRDVDYYSYLNKSYNIPEFITGTTRLNGYKLSRIAKKSKGIDVSLSVR